MDDELLDPSGGIVWCFTYGHPGMHVVDGFAQLLALGNLRWVIIPMYEGGLRAADHEWLSAPASS